MRPTILSVAIAIATVSAAACAKIPGAPQYKMKKAKTAVASLLIDPTSPIFEDVRVKLDAVCGWSTARIGWAHT